MYPKPHVLWSAISLISRYQSQKNTVCLIPTELRKEIDIICTPLATLKD
jgi:hypothetical protein